MDFIFINMVSNNGMKGIRQMILVLKYFIFKTLRELIKKQLQYWVRILFLLYMHMVKKEFNFG